MMSQGWLAGLGPYVEGATWPRAGRMLVLVGAAALVLLVIRLLVRGLRRSMILAQGTGQPEVERRARTVAAVVENAARVVVLGVFLLQGMAECGINIGPLAAGAGLLGAGLGLGGQTLVRDLLGGMTLLLEDRFSVGDIIQVGERHAGVVERLTLRTTVLRDLEGRAHFLPNGSLGEVVVLSKEFAVAMVDLAVSPADDPDRVMAVLADLGRNLAADMPEVLAPTEVLGIESLDALACVIRTTTRTQPAQQWKVAREFRRRALARFKQEGFRRPLPVEVEVRAEAGPMLAWH